MSVAIDFGAPKHKMDDDAEVQKKLKRDLSYAPEWSTPASQVEREFYETIQRYENAKVFADQVVEEYNVLDAEHEILKNKHRYLELRIEYASDLYRAFYFSIIRGAVADLRALLQERKQLFISHEFQRYTILRDTYNNDVHTNRPHLRWTALTIAVCAFQPDVVQLLVDNGFDIRLDYPLIDLIKHDTEIDETHRVSRTFEVLLLLDDRVPDDIIYMMCDAFSETDAVFLKSFERRLKVAIERGGNVNYRNPVPTYELPEIYKTSLNVLLTGLSSFEESKAVDDVWFHMVRLLVDHGANVNDCSSWHPLLCIPLSKIAETSHPEAYTSVFHLLIAYGADINLTRPPLFTTPLKYVIEHCGETYFEFENAHPGFENALQLVLDENPNLELGDDGSTALIVAVENTNFKGVEMLLRKGAMPTAVDDSGITALDHAFSTKEQWKKFRDPERFEKHIERLIKDADAVIVLLQRHMQSGDDSS